MREEQYILKAALKGRDLITLEGKIHRPLDPARGIPWPTLVNSLDGTEYRLQTGEFLTVVDQRKKKRWADVLHLKPDGRQQVLQPPRTRPELLDDYFEGAYTGRLLTEPQRPWPSVTIRQFSKLVRRRGWRLQRWDGKLNLGGCTCPWSIDVYRGEKFAGQVRLERGDHLTAYNRNGTVHWQGIVRVRRDNEKPVSTKHEDWVKWLTLFRLSEDGSGETGPFRATLLKPYEVG